MSSNKTVDDLKFNIAQAIVDNEVKENIETFEMCAYISGVSKYARMKMLALCLAKEIYHLGLSHEDKLNAAQQANEFIVKMLQPREGRTP